MTDRMTLLTGDRLVLTDRIEELLKQADDIQKQVDNIDSQMAKELSRRGVMEPVAATPTPKAKRQQPGLGRTPALRETMRMNGEPLTRDEIFDEVHALGVPAHHENERWALKRLVDAGEIVEVEPGLYLWHQFIAEDTHEETPAVATQAAGRGRIQCLRDLLKASGPTGIKPSRLFELAHEAGIPENNGGEWWALNNLVSKGQAIRIGDALYVWHEFAPTPTLVGDLPAQPVAGDPSSESAVQ